MRQILHVLRHQCLAMKAVCAAPAPGVEYIDPVPAMSAAATLHGQGCVPAAAVGAARVPVVRHTAPAPAVSLRRVQVAPAAVDQVHRTSTAVQDATALPVEDIGPALAVCGSWCTSANARIHRAGPLQSTLQQRWSVVQRHILLCAQHQSLWLSTSHPRPQSHAALHQDSQIVAHPRL